MTYKVVSPYVTMRVKDANTGGEVLLGFYANAPVPDSVNPEDLKRLLRKGMVAEGDTPVVADVAPAGTPAAEGDAGDAAGRGEQKSDRPAGNASQAAWLDYAVAKRPEGMTEDEAREAYGSSTRNELAALFG